MNLARNTVRKYLRGSPAAVARPKRGSKLDPYKEQIVQWVQQDHLYIHQKTIRPGIIASSMLDATDDETMASLTQRMRSLEDQKREAESLLYDATGGEEERAVLDAEITKFEKWAGEVRPLLTDPAYLATAGYAEIRLAIKILGLRCTVFPTLGNWPYRYKIEVTTPEIT